MNTIRQHPKFPGNQPFNLSNPKKQMIKRNTWWNPLNPKAFLKTAMGKLNANT